MGKGGVAGGIGIALLRCSRVGWPTLTAQQGYLYLDGGQGTLRELPLPGLTPEGSPDWAAVRCAVGNKRGGALPGLVHVTCCWAGGRSGREEGHAERAWVRSMSCALL